MKVGQSASYSRIESIIEEMNLLNRAEELISQQMRQFHNLDDDEIAEQLDGQTVEEYFERELEELGKFELEEVGDDCQVGSSFVVIRDPDGDAMASFVMDGYAGEGIFQCCYISPTAPSPFNAEDE